MYMIGTDGLGVSFGEKVLFQDLSFSVNQGERVAIVGVNGAGKSTLMRLLYDPNFLPHTGKVFLAKGKSVGFMEQLPTLDPETTVLDAALSVFGDLLEEERRLEELTAAMNQDPSEENIARFTTLQSRFTDHGGYEFRSRARGTLIGMGFAQDVLERAVGTLSGGQKTILQLALLILREPDILLLDEPTNHLDIQSLEWLEDRLSRLRSTILVISHDRFFLDRVTQKTLELENGRCKLYGVPYSQYREQKKKDREIQERHYQNQQKEIARMEAFIEQQRRWNRERNIIAAESRQKAIDRMVKVEKVSALPENLSFRFTEALESGNDVLSVKELSKGFDPASLLFSHLSFEVKKGDRLVITGANGSGKSTLLQILTGNLSPTEGSFHFGYNVRLGYYDQYQHLNEENTVLEELWDDSDLGHTQVRKLLATFLFKGEDVYKKISVLSGGERARIVLAKLMQKKVNLLVLDEPTNHLDVESREALEEALLAFDGTILAVSHDRYFIRRLATRILHFRNSSFPPNKRIFLFAGGYEDYLRYRMEQKEAPPETATGESTGGNDWELRKREKQKSRKRAARLEKIEGEISRLEDEIREIDRLCTEHSSDYQALQEFYAKREQLQNRCDDLWEEWTLLEEENDPV